MPNDDEQKRHISRVISAIRDDDTPDNELGRDAVEDADELADEEYYVDEEERRQWDYDEVGPVTRSAVEDQEEHQPRRGGNRPVGWGLLLDWRLIAALAILVAGLFMVNFSGDDEDPMQELAVAPAVAGGDAPAQASGAATSHGADEIARLEARIAALEQRLAAVGADGAEGFNGEEATLFATANMVTKDEVQVLRDQVNAGLKAQQDATKAAVRDLEQRLTRTIETKVAASRSAQPQIQTQTQPSAGGSQSAATAAGGGWFVNVATYSQRATADAMVKRLQDSGHSVAIVPATIGGEPSFRVRVTSLTSRDAAQKTARELESQLDVRGLWVGEN